jgi:predicted hotdog family 3-hydroxylacyl-ACP dehydratase
MVQRGQESRDNLAAGGGRVISAQDIYKYIPHRPPMVWIDWVTRYSAVDGECLVDVKKDALYMGAEGLRPSSCVEFIAQTYGFVWICYVTKVLDPTSKGMSVAMLAAFKDVKFAAPEVIQGVKQGDRLVCKISGIRAMGPITSFQGEVWKGDILLTQAQMRTFSQ